MLTGPPRIGDALLPIMAMELWCDVRWRDESLYYPYADGSFELYKPQFRAVIKGGWATLSYPDLKQLHGLTSRPFEITPRTWKAGDPGGAPELTLLVRRRPGSEIQETTPLHRLAGDRRPLHFFEMELEGMVLLPAIPDELRGGLYQTGRTDVALLVETWGEVTRTYGTQTLTYGAITVEATTVAYGPDDIVDQLIRPVPGNPAAVTIDFLNDFRAPLPAETS